VATLKFWRKKAPPQPTPGYNMPRMISSTGLQQLPQPKGFAAPPAYTPHASEILDQRISERVLAFGTRVALQNWLRQQKTVLVTPLEVDAHHLDAPSPVTSSDSMYIQGAYNTDYTQMLSSAAAPRVGPVNAPPAFQNIPGYTDLQTTLVLNGQYSQINANLAPLYMGLSAPGPFQGLDKCP
jgi:hypothetical protein